MTGSSFRYLMKEGARSIWSNRMMSVASILVSLACLLLIGGSILVVVNINSFLDAIEGQNEMSIFLDEGLGEIEINNIRTDLERIEWVEDIVFISSEEALASLKDDSNYGALLDGLEGEKNPLPATFRITLNDISKTAEVKDLMERSVGVDEVRAATYVADILTKVRNGISIGGSTIVLLLVVVSLVITANTIKLTVFNRRKEINIMKFVGATDGFIRLPFIVEGILLGLVSSVLAYFVTWGYYTYIVNWTQVAWGSGSLSNLIGSLVPFIEIAPYLLMGFIVGGLCTGAVGSLLFVRKHLKV